MKISTSKPHLPYSNPLQVIAENRTNGKREFLRKTKKMEKLKTKLHENFFWLLKKNVKLWKNFFSGKRRKIVLQNCLRNFNFYREEWLNGEYFEKKLLKKEKLEKLKEF